MNAVLVTDGRFAINERAMLRRLEVGLADEGVRVSLVTPAGLGGEPMGVSLVARSTPYQPDGMALTRRLRAGRTADRLFGQGLPRDAGTLVHVFGERAWYFGAELAMCLRAGLLLEVWRSGLVNRLRSIEALSDFVAVAPGAGIERAVRGRLNGSRVRLARWGVHTPAEPSPVMSTGSAISIAMITRGSPAKLVQAAFTAASRIARSMPDTMLVVDAQSSHAAGLWGSARKLGVREQLTLVDGLEQQRELVLTADLMLFPDRAGEVRSIMLDAMAAGIPVIAGMDEDVELITSGQISAALTDEGASAWESAIRAVIDDPESARRAAVATRSYVAEQRRVSSHVAGVLDIYESMSMSNETTAFRSSA